MWITELATNTITAESRIGSHSDSRLTMETPLVAMWPVQSSGGAGRNLTKAAPPNQMTQPWARRPGWGLPSAPGLPAGGCASARDTDTVKVPLKRRPRIPGAPIGPAPTPRKGHFAAGQRERKLLFEKRKCGTCGNSRRL